MGIPGAVEWWEKWQLRILVLGSLLIQWFLFLSATHRKRALPSWFRSLMWLSYLGSDAVSIYALATLFSRQRKQDYSSVDNNSILEVVWAPVLLMHLGGQDFIAAYNIEDNELWTRHVLTAVSQITVAIYVFYKKWPGGDKKLLQASILLFVPGIIKCIEKPWALKRASFNSLVSLSDTSPHSWRMVSKASLQDYVQKARALVLSDCHPEAIGEGAAVDIENNHAPQAHGKVDVADVEPSHVLQAQDSDAADLEPKYHPQSRRERYQAYLRMEELGHAAHKLFVDLPSLYPDRLNILQTFLMDNVDKKAHASLQKGIFGTFDLLYTKDKIMGIHSGKDIDTKSLPAYLRMVGVVLPFTAIALFHKSHREAYNVNDVNVTYALLCCTAVLEVLSMWTTFLVNIARMSVTMDCVVSQYSLVGFFARNRRHSKKMRILSSLKCKGFLDQRWCMKPCFSSSRITELVFGYVKLWWEEHIVDAASYRRFNDHRGDWTVQHKGCNQDLEWGLDRPFDESVILWHTATDLCFYQKGDPSVSHEKAMGCREISNYMIYLLFINPEMLLPGTRRNLFLEANTELEEILKGDKRSLRAILKGDKTSVKDIERGIMERIIGKLQLTECREEDPGCTEMPPDGERHPATQEGFIHNARELANNLLDIGDRNKMWEVIEGVWVEMLCFSASRSRGYLHAKSLGTGVELLTYVWLLLSHMGMETLPERLQRRKLSSGEGNAGAAPTTS